MTGWQTRDDLEHLMRFNADWSRILANHLRIICHVLIDSLPDDEIPDIEADLLDKSSIYFSLDHDRTPRLIERQSKPRKEPATFGPVLAGKQ